MTPKLPALVSAAMSLRAANATAWEEMLAALKERQLDLMTQMVAAPVGTLPTAQGRAQEATALHKILSDAPALAASFANRGTTTNVRHNPAAPDPFTFP